MILKFKTILIVFCISIVLTSFLTNSNSIAAPKHIVFNLTGAFNGYGDVTGPLWTLIEMKNRDRENSRFTVILDERSKNIVRSLFAGKSIPEIAKQLNLFFVEKIDADKIKKSDYSVEAFYGGRRIHHLTDLVYTTDKTVTIISDTMHGRSFDEIRRPGLDSHIYFKPPGIGPQRSGIVSNPDVLPFLRKSLPERRLIAARMFRDSQLGQIISGERYPKMRTGFVYGVHNEFFDGRLVGQTKRYIDEILKSQTNEGPTFIFSPNKVADLERAVSGLVPVVGRETLSGDSDFIIENKLYLVSVGSVSNEQFTGLMASSGLPVLVEGNSAVSSALQMRIPFLMMRSPWNSAQVGCVVNLEQKYCKTGHFKSIYDLSKTKLPCFKEKVTESPSEIFYTALSIRLPDLSIKFHAIINIIERLKKLELNAEFNNTKTNIGKEYLALSEFVLKSTQDEVFSYSIIFDAFQRNIISHEVLKAREDSLRTLGFNPEKMRHKFVPVVPGFSAKIMEFDRLRLKEKEARKLQFISEMDQRLFESLQLRLLSYEPVNEGYEAEIFKAIDKKGKTWAVKILRNSERADLNEQERKKLQESQVHLPDEHRTFEFLRNNGFRRNVPKSAIFNEYTLIKEFLNGQTLFDILNADLMTPQMGLQLSNLFKDLCRKRLYVKDLHGFNLIYSNETKEWVIIDSNGVVENDRHVQQSYYKELSRHWEGAFEGNRGNPQTLKNILKIKSILLDELRDGGDSKDFVELTRAI